MLQQNRIKMGWLFAWQAICILIALAIIYVTWNWSLIHFLNSINLAIPPFLVGTFKAIVYVFCGGALGSSLYVSYRAYSHIVYPDNHVGEGDIIEDELAQKGNKMAIKDKIEDRLEETRRFSENARLWWYLRPLLGAVVGVVVYALLRLITTPLYSGSGVGCGGGGYYYGYGSNLYYFGIAFITGFCFGDFVKFVQSNSKKMFSGKK